MLTCVVEVPRARALVNSAHMMPLKMRFRPKNICIMMSYGYKYDYLAMKNENIVVGGRKPCNLSFPAGLRLTPRSCRDDYENNYQMRKEGKHTARTTTSTPPSISDNPMEFATQVAKLVVSSVVVLHIDAKSANWRRRECHFRFQRTAPMHVLRPMENR